jgi:outer membrane protein assembly factor BamB
MNQKRFAVGIACSLAMVAVLMSPSIGMGPSSWSYRITLLTASALSNDGERFLIGCEYGEYFVLNRYGNIILNGNFEQEIHAVDIAENGNMIFGVENGVVFLDSQGKLMSQVYPIEPVLYVSMTKNGLYAVAGTQKEIFLMDTQGLMWQSEIITEDSPETFISNVVISASGSTIAVAVQKKVYIFGWASNEIKAEIKIESIVTSLEILPDGKDVAIGTEEGIFFLYNIYSKEKSLYPLEGSVNSIAVNSKQILVGTSKGIVLFDRDRNILQKPHIEESVNACDISDDGKFIVVLDSESNVSSFNILTGEMGWKFYIRDPISVKLSKYGKYVGITRKNGVYFLKNWEDTFDGTGYFPYSSHASPGYFSLENDLDKLWFYNAEGIDCFDYGDVNGDGQNEVVLGSGAELVVLDHQGNLIWEKPFPAGIEFVWLHDLTEDNVPEILIGFDDGKLNMGVWSGEGELLATFDFMDEFYVAPHPGDISIEPIAAMDIDQDGIVEIICGVKIGYFSNPGGIFVFKYPSGEKQWDYPIAPFQVSGALTDINNDGNLELVLGSHSFCKGTAVRERDDCHVYVMVVDLEGNEIWAKEIASGFRQLLVAVSDLDGNGQKEIIGTVGSEDDTYGKLFILDNKGNLKYEEEFDHSIFFGAIADFEKDGYQEIVVTNTEGNVAMYDYGLEPLREFLVGYDITPYVKGIADLDGNGTSEIILVTDSGKLMILNSNFDELVSLDFDEEPQVVMANISGCAIDLLVHFSDRIELYSLKNERTHLCFLIEESYLIPQITPDRCFAIAETHYKNLEFEEAWENYEKAKRLYEETGNIGKILESIRMNERIESINESVSKVHDGKEKLIEGDFENARYDFIEAKVLFERLVKGEEFSVVEKWLQSQINECENQMKVCTELEKASDDIKNGKRALEEQNFEEAKEYFESALQTFEKHNLEQYSQQVREYLEEINENLELIYRENKIRGYLSTGILLNFWLLLLAFWLKRYKSTPLLKTFIPLTVLILVILILAYAPNLGQEIFIFIREHLTIFGILASVGLASIGWKYLPGMVYRNKNYSILDSLFYTFHLKKFPSFSPISNPYYAGIPVRDESMFFGRKDVFDFLKNRLASSSRNPVIIIYGERKTGKTSILFQIENGRLELDPEFIPVYIDMNKMTTNNDYEFLSTLSSRIQEALKSNNIQMPTIPYERKENPYLFFKDYFLQNLVDSIGQKHFLFLIDEYGVIERKLIENKLSKDIFSFLKSLIECETKFNFIFAGSKKIEEFENSDEWARTLTASVYRKISFLKKEDATRLIKDPAAEKVWYTNRAVKELLDLSGCHPYILQYLCFNLINLLNETESLTVDIKEVEKVLQDVIENPMIQMTLLWTTLTQDQKILVSFLAETVQKKGGSISQEEIIIKLEKKNIRLKDLFTIFNSLEDKGILKREKIKYEFCMDIIRRFSAKYHPLLRVLQEVET